MESLDARLQKRMHVSLYALLFLTCLLALSVLLEGCTDTCETETQYTYFEPVYKSFQEIQSETRIEAARPMTTVGKIYLKDSHLFVNDPGNGIHIINNANPSQPVIQHFLSIPGNYDLAVKGNILYADSYIDLVAFDISDVSNIHEVKRVKNVFSYFNFEFGFSADAEKGIITSWQERKDVKYNKGDCSTPHHVGPILFDGHGVFAESTSRFNASLAIAPGTGSGPGVGGSMARFTINENYLYALNSGQLLPFDVTNEKNPIAADRLYVAWDIETIFPYGDYLFLGSSSGMHIISVANPGLPERVSTYQHIRSCDPVVVQGNYAYVTLRSGTECTGFTNQLEVIDIQDVANPALVKIYPMHNPHGLGIDNHLLFICDGSAGLKVFDAEDITTIDQNLLKHYSAIDAFDVIPFNNILIMIGANGLYQYDYSDPKNIFLLSHINVQ
jgi:hypothetical protein